MGNIFNAVAHFQFNFALSDFFIRGGIAVSDLYMDENIVVGPGLIEAYELENRVANFPRIILSKEAHEVIKSHLRYYSNPKHSPQFTEYLIDKDGLVFLNYLQIAIDQSPQGDSYDEEKINNLIIDHKNIIIKNLTKYQSNYKVLQKFCWIADYHNFFCKKCLIRIEGIDKKSILISERLYKVKIKNLRQKTNLQ